MASEEGDRSRAAVADTESDDDGGVSPGLLYGGALAVGVTFWLKMITVEVEGVYLDEEFHVRQALVYLANRFSVWDPKITTPPGVYLVAYPWLQLLRLLHVRGSPETHLRALNAIALLFLFHTAWQVADAIRAERRPKARQDDKPAQPAAGADPGPEPELATDADGGSTVLVALSAALFPPLFFFSALFYTDVLSALVVLQTHLAFYRRQGTRTFVLGLASLAFRQTNVFWTGAYLAALEARRTLRELNAARRGRPRHEGLRSGWADVARLAWSEGLVYDPEAPTAGVEDYVKGGLSLALAAVANLQHLVVPLLPHLLVIASFGLFVFWNGGVVLGDKSNHVATLHAPQMLYIWPCFAFFSFPLLLRDVFTAAISLVWPLLPASFKPTDLKFRPTANLPRPLVALFFTAAALAAVHFNTIVHPFILADNRHFTFYVFRLLMRHPAIKYAATPVYVTCGWACLTAGAAEAETRREQGRAAASVSQVLIWLVVAAASLVTAPLVEPRYFILPWLLWSLNLSSARGVLDLQMNWMAIVNTAVGYIFLYWGFQWPQQPEQVMRFMW